MSVLFLFALQAAQPRFVEGPSLVEDLCAEGALTEIKRPYPLKTPGEALALARPTDPFLDLTIYMINHQAEISGPDCVVERDGATVHIQGECSYAQGFTSTGELSVTIKAPGQSVVARSFELRDAATGAVRRYEGVSYTEVSPDGIRQASAGTFDFSGPNPIAVMQPSGLDDRSFSQEMCLINEGELLRLTARATLPGKRRSSGTVVTALVGSTSPSTPGEYSMSVRGSVQYDMVADASVAGRPCLRVQSEGVDLGEVCMGD